MTSNNCPEQTFIIQTRSEEEGRYLPSSPDFHKKNSDSFYKYGVGTVSKEARQLISMTRYASYYRRRITSPFPDRIRKGEQYGKI